MAAPFEEPAKIELKARCEIAIDQAGFDLVEKVTRVELPADAEVQGALKGDLQSLDGEGQRYCYYVRPNPPEVLPEWLAKLATAAHHVANVKFYLVVPAVNDSLRASCESAGAGLLMLNEDEEFEHVLDFDELMPTVPDEVVAEQVRGLRRRLEAKLDLDQNAIQSKIESVSRETRGMDEKTAAGYREKLERDYRELGEWAANISEVLDQAYSARDLAVLDGLGGKIDAGFEGEG